MDRITDALELVGLLLLIVAAAVAAWALIGGPLGVAAGAGTAGVLLVGTSWFIVRRNRRGGAA